MSYCISCHDCGETVYPPVDATGHGGKSEIAALRLALEHAKETGHQEIHVIAGCYYTGDGERPTAFGDGVTDPEAVAKPDKATLVDAVGAAANRLRDMADQVERWGTNEPAIGVRQRSLRQYADAIESNVYPGSFDYPDRTDCPTCGEDHLLVIRPCNPDQIPHPDD